MYTKNITKQDITFNYTKNIHGNTNVNILFCENQYNTQNNILFLKLNLKQNLDLFNI